MNMLKELKPFKDEHGRWQWSLKGLRRQHGGRGGQHGGARRAARLSSQATHWPHFSPPQVCVLSQVQPSVTPWTAAPGSAVHGDSPGKNTGVGGHALLQGIFVTRALTLCLWRLLPWQAGSLPLHHLGSPVGA